MPQPSKHSMSLDAVRMETLNALNSAADKLNSQRAQSRSDQLNMHKLEWGNEEALLLFITMDLSQP